MSDEKVLEAKYPGFGGPHFPETLESIQKRFRYHPERFNEPLYDLLRRRVRGRLIYLPQTSDVKSRLRSPWACGLSFEWNGKKYKICFPTTHDSDRIDGSYSNRHVALYVVGEATKLDLERAGRRIARLFNTTYRFRYASAISDSKRRKRESETV